MSEAFYTCEGCGERIELEAPDTVKANRMRPSPDYDDGPTSMYPAEGLAFHQRCWPGDSKTLRRMTD